VEHVVNVEAESLHEAATGDPEAGRAELRIDIGL
jgi:hypothetical protein